MPPPLQDSTSSGNGPDGELAVAPYVFRVLIAYRLRRGRRTTGLTQRELAQRLGVSRSVVAEWEQGAHYPPLHRLSEVAELCGTSIGALLASSPQPDAPDAEPHADEHAAGRAAAEEVRRAHREGRHPAAPGVIAQAVTSGDGVPKRGRPAGRPAAPPVVTERSVAAPPAPTQPAPVAASTARAEEAARLATGGMRDRVAAVLAVGGLPEHEWARRDLARYWALLETWRGALAKREVLAPGTARRLAPALDLLVTTDITAPADARTRLKLWSAHDALAHDARAYFTRVERHGEIPALVCMDAIAQAAAVGAAADARIGTLLELLGDVPDWS